MLGTTARALCRVWFRDCLLQVTAMFVLRLVQFWQPDVAEQDARSQRSILHQVWRLLDSRKAESYHISQLDQESVSIHRLSYNALKTNSPVTENRAMLHVIYQFY